MLILIVSLILYYELNIIGDRFEVLGSEMDGFVDCNILEVGLCFGLLENIDLVVLHMEIGSWLQVQIHKVQVEFAGDTVGLAFVVDVQLDHRDPSYWVEASLLLSFLLQTRRVVVRRDP